MKPVDQFMRRLRSTLVKRGQSPDDAEDLVQEAFLKLEAYGRKAEVREPEAFVVRAALNLSIDANRRRRKSPFADTDVEVLSVADSSAGPDEVLNARDRLRRMQAGLDTLPTRTRDILLANRLEGITHAEIARREGISVSAVEKHVARGVYFLMDWMEGW